MPSLENRNKSTLAELGVSDPMAVADEFAKLRNVFDFQLSAKSQRNEIIYRDMHQAWLGRKSGVLSEITDNWLKTATGGLKPFVGQELNAFRKYVEERLEQFRVEVETRAEEAAGAKDRVDLSLPGVVRALGSRHLIRQVFKRLKTFFSVLDFRSWKGRKSKLPITTSKR